MDDSNDTDDLPLADDTESAQDRQFDLDVEEPIQVSQPRTEVLDAEETFVDIDSPVVVPKPQVLQSLNPRDYRIRVVVCGTRHYNDRKKFHEVLCRYVAKFKQPILFVSGAAKTGADRLIILWCRKFGFPCLEMPADWDTHGKPAGYIRNSAMGRLATRVLAFFDGESNGTANMIEIGLEKGIPVVIIKIEIPNTYQPFSSYPTGSS